MPRSMDLGGLGGTPNLHWRELIDETVVRLSLPYQHGFVNSYLVLGNDGPRLIDTGAGIAAASDQLAGHLAAFGAEFRDVKAILLTHAHQDHIGMAVAIAEMAGATVLIHHLEVASDYTFASPMPSNAWFECHGLPASSGFVQRQASPLPKKLALVDGGEKIDFGPLELELHWTPGHSPGLICAFDRNRQWLFTSDHVLRMPTPLAIRRDVEADPVADYLNSLESVSSLPARLALPGHGRTFQNVREAIDVARAAQLHWLEQAYDAVPAEGATAIEVAQRLSWGEAGNATQAWLAICRCVAYLRHLELDGRLRREEGAVVRFLRLR